MRKRVLALAVCLFAPSAFATPAGPEPALTAGESSFASFGTKFCLGAARGCDVTVAEPPERTPVARAPAVRPTLELGRAHVVTLLGLKLCSAPRDGTCHVLWSPPPPAAGWRDYPELRVAAR